MLGNHPAAVINPSQMLLWVVSVRYTPMATDCIQVPIEEMNDELSAREKLRRRRGAKELEDIDVTLHRRELSSTPPQRGVTSFCSFGAGGMRTTK